MVTYLLILQNYHPLQVLADFMHTSNCYKPAFIQARYIFQQIQIKYFHCFSTLVAVDSESFSCYTSPVIVILSSYLLTEAVTLNHCICISCLQFCIFFKKRFLYILLVDFYFAWLAFHVITDRFGTYNGFLQLCHYLSLVYSSGTQTISLLEVICIDCYVYTYSNHCFCSDSVHVSCFDY